MKKYYVALFLSLFVSVVYSQPINEYTLPVSAETIKFIKKTPKFKRLLKTKFTTLKGGRVVIGNFNGSDSVNFKPCVLSVKILPSHISKTEVSVKEYMEFVEKNNGVYQDVNLKPSIDTVNGTSSDFFQDYLAGKKYQDYPIIGVSYVQAMAYCDWMTAKLNEQFTKNSKVKFYCRLPTDAEMQFVMINSFEPVTGMLQNVPSDKFVNDNNTSSFPNSPVRTNKAPILSIYNIVNNVAEWVLDTPRSNPDERIYNNDLAKETEKYCYKLTSYLSGVAKDGNLRKVKGGSFNQSGFYKQPGVSTPLDKRKGYSWVGFRLWLSYSDNNIKKRVKNL